MKQCFRDQFRNNFWLECKPRGWKNFVAFRCENRGKRVVCRTSQSFLQKMLVPPRAQNKTNKRSIFSFRNFWILRGLSGPLDRLNAIQSLLQPLDRYRTPSAIGSAIGRPLSRPISHSNAGGSPQPPRSKPLGGLNRAIVVRGPPKGGRPWRGSVKIGPGFFQVF